MKTSFYVFAVLLVVGLFYGTAYARDATREQCIECTMRYIDISPRDGHVTALEIDAARDRYLSWLERKLSPSTSDIVRKCDYNKDGYLTREDMQLSTTTCLAKQEKINDYYDYICKRAEKAARAH